MLLRLLAIFCFVRWLRLKRIRRHLKFINIVAALTLLFLLDARSAVV